MVTAALTLSFAALLVTTAAAFALADRCNQLQFQIQELRNLVSDMVDGRIVPLTAEDGIHDESTSR